MQVVLNPNSTHASRKRADWRRTFSSASGHGPLALSLTTHPEPPSPRDVAADEGHLLQSKLTSMHTELCTLRLRETPDAVLLPWSFNPSRPVIIQFGSSLLREQYNRLIHSACAP